MEGEALAKIETTRQGVVVESYSMAASKAEMRSLSEQSLTVRGGVRAAEIRHGLRSPNGPGPQHVIAQVMQYKYRLHATTGALVHEVSFMHFGIEFRKMFFES